MKIVIDFRKFDGVVGGVEKGVIRISEYAAHQGHPIVLLFKEKRTGNVKKVLGDVPNIKLVPLKVDTHAMSLRNAWMDAIDIQNIAEEEGADVIHFPYNWSFPFRKKAPCILTIHDVIPFAFREAMGLYRNRFLYKPGMRMACALNDIIVTVSEFSKTDVVRKVGVSPEKIRVIPNGLRPPTDRNKDMEAKLKKRFNLAAGFILNVGGIHERKNIPRLIQAFAKLVNGRDKYPGKLLITGSASGAPYQVKMRKICDQAVKEAGMSERIIFTGFVSDKELDSLFALASLLIYPSLYEGFGIPILEAMQVGTPVITSNITGTLEVAHDAAILIDPYNVDEMTSQMSRLLGDNQLRAELSKKGKARASSYSWDSTAEQYLELYKYLADR